jgi:hypothetical protein
MFEKRILSFKDFSLLEANYIDPPGPGSSTDKEAFQKMRAAIFFLNAKYPFFAGPLSKLNIKENRKLRFRTMATDGYSIHYDPGYVLSHSQEEIMWVIAHEIMHNVLLHFSRCPKDKKGSLIWNVATDYAINQMLTELDENALANGRAIPSSDPKKSLGKMPGGSLYPGCGYVPGDDKFANMSSEQIIAELNRMGWTPPEPEEGQEPPPPQPPAPPEVPKVGEVIYDVNKQRYGVVTKVDESTGDLEYDPIPKEKVGEYIKGS